MFDSQHPDGSSQLLVISMLGYTLTFLASAGTDICYTDIHAAKHRNKFLKKTIINGESPGKWITFLKCYKTERSTCLIPI